MERELLEPILAKIAQKFDKSVFDGFEDLGLNHPRDLDRLIRSVTMLLNIHQATDYENVDSLENYLSNEWRIAGIRLKDLVMKPLQTDKQQKRIRRPIEQLRSQFSEFVPSDTLDKSSLWTGNYQRKRVCSLLQFYRTSFLPKERQESCSKHTREIPVENSGKGIVIENWACPYLLELNRSAMIKTRN